MYLLTFDSVDIESALQHNISNHFILITGPIIAFPLSAEMIMNEKSAMCTIPIHR